MNTKRGRIEWESYFTLKHSIGKDLQSLLLGNQHLHILFPPGLFSSPNPYSSFCASFFLSECPQSIIIVLFCIIQCSLCLQPHSLTLLVSTLLQDEFDKLRPLCYTSADVFLLCFSVVSPVSFQNIPEKWVQEIRRHAPFAPIILVGTQCDLREDVKVLSKCSV